MSAIADYHARVAALVLAKLPGSEPVSEHTAKRYMMLGYTEKLAAATIVAQRTT